METQRFLFEGVFISRDVVRSVQAVRHADYVPPSRFKQTEHLTQMFTCIVGMEVLDNLDADGGIKALADKPLFEVDS